MNEYYTIKTAFRKSRWTLQIDLELFDDERESITFVASSDSFLTDGDGLWFGTLEEWEEAMNE